MKTVERELSVDFGGTVEKGGKWSPTACKPRRKVRPLFYYLSIPGFTMFLMDTRVFGVSGVIKNVLKLKTRL